MSKLVHTFDNQIKVYDYQLLEAQKNRYIENNIHEAEEEPVFLNMIDDMPQSGVFVNIGAAIGYYPLLAASVRDDIRLVSYEPLKVHRQYFLENIRLNRINNSKFQIYPEGVYKRRGYVKFKQNGYSSTLIESEDENKLWSQITGRFSADSIYCVTLNDVVQRENGIVDLVQMDIQGLEREVLSSSELLLSKHSIKRFLVGTHSKDIHESCKKTLSKNGYVIQIDKFDTELQPDGILLGVSQ